MPCYNYIIEIYYAIEINLLQTRTNKEPEKIIYLLYCQPSFLCLVRIAPRKKPLKIHEKHIFKIPIEKGIVGRQKNVQSRNKY